MLNKTMVVYKCDDEVIVTTLENETETLREYFGDRLGRSLDEYERLEGNEPAIRVRLSASMRVDGVK